MRREVILRIQHRLLEESRSGIWATAILAILGGALMIAVIALFTVARGGLPLPLVFVLVYDFVFIGVGGWAIVSGIGLIRQRAWARKSFFVFPWTIVFILTLAGFWYLMPLPAVFAAWSFFYLDGAHIKSHSLGK
jgi:hypothetical protein